MAPTSSMNPIYLFFLVLFLGMNSCQKDKDLFEEALEEEISENSEDEVDSEGEEPTDEDNVEDDGKEEGFSDDFLKAFPSAYGAGSQVTGGRGQQVFFVTNLNASGSGSFLQALYDAETNGGGNIVFHVSGTIRLNDRLYSSASNITIAGQTAPEGGIDITGKGFVFSGSNNVIIRHIRFRPEYSEFDTVGFVECDNVIIDHCSLSWGGDEVISFWGDSDNVTMQRLLIAEGKTGTILGDSDDPAISSNLSLHNSLYYNITHRFPNPNSNERIDVINNVVYNWKYRLSTPTGDVKLNHINNYYALGCLSSIIGVENKIFEGDEPTIYTSGNYVDKGILTNKNADNWTLWKNFYAETQAASNFNTKVPYNLLGDALPILTSEETLANVVQDVGANRVLDANGNIVFYQDELDSMFLSNVASKNCVDYQSSSFGQDYMTTAHYQSYHSSVSGTPKASHSTNFDSDLDGMPDIWEITKFGDLSKNGRQDSDGNGYTDLEEYLNLVDANY